MDEVDALFLRQKETSTEFAREIGRLLNSNNRPTQERIAQVNLKIAKTVFSKWSIEILTILYGGRSVGYADLKRALRGITSRVLSEKLKKLELSGLLKREIVGGRPPRTTYSLTETGVTVAKLGEPVFIYLAYKEGLYALPKLVEKTRWY